VLFLYLITNDIYLNNKKCGGILIDCDCLGAKEFHLKIGFGINCEQQMNEINSTNDKSITQQATSIQQELNSIPNHLVDLRKIREQLLAGIMNRFQSLLQESNWNSVTKLYSKYDLTLNQTIIVMPNKREDESSYYTATSKGINNQGNLIVIKDKTAEEIVLVAEEVGIRLK